MRHFKYLAAAAALTLAVVPFSMNAFAEGGVSDTEPVKVEAVCEHINPADINGRAVISVPEGASADVSIVYESPEYDAHSYYESSLEGGKSYYFDLEGRDNIGDDYRNYTVSVELTGGVYDVTSKAYTDTFSIPDGNDNPDSFCEKSYKFTVDGAESTAEWDVTLDEENAKEIAVHLDYVKLGDVNGDTNIDAVDANLVLGEYAALITERPSTLTPKGSIAADVNHDDVVDSSDAAKILAYYSASLTGGNPTLE